MNHTDTQEPAAPPQPAPLLSPWLRGDLGPSGDHRLVIWQGLCAALLALWLFTFAFMYFGSQLSSWQSLGVLKGELVSAVQQLAQQQQALAQRLQTLEQGKGKE